MGYDIIGDIHGHAGKLEGLLRKLGYGETGGAWRHPGRQAIFVGDFIDRGPQQLQTVDRVRRMIDAGSALAIMGNHEFNAIAWHTPDPKNPGDFLRTHSGDEGRKNLHQHSKFLSEVESRAGLHADLIEWFLTLPLWLDLPGLRVVHACWHGAFMEWAAPRFHNGRFLTRELMAEATDEPENEAEKDSANPSMFKAAEALTKGIEIPLPVGHNFIDKDGITRRRVRVRWWDESADTYRKAALLSDKQCRQLPDEPIPSHARIGIPDHKPVFFGHYWLTGEPAIQSSQAACVDYSAGQRGPLVAYRWEGESDLNQGSFVQFG
jgi:hypothetical protein